MYWLQIKELQIVHAQFVLFTEDVAHQCLNVGEVSFFWLVSYRLVQIQEVVYYLTIVHMVGNGTETVLLWNVSQIVLAIILTKCFVVPDNALLDVSPVQSGLAHYLVERCANSDKRIFACRYISVHNLSFCGMIHNIPLRFLLYLRFRLDRILTKPRFQFRFLEIEHFPLWLVMGYKVTCCQLVQVTL